MANGIVLNIDTTKSEFQNPMVQLRQGDGNYQSLSVTVTSNGEPFDLTGWTTTFMGTTAGGFKIVDSAVTVKNALQGQFTYTPPKSWGQDQGEFKNAYFKFTKSEETASGASFRVNVLDAVDLTAAEAGNYISIVDQTISKLNGDLSTLQRSVNDLKAQNNAIKTTDNTWSGKNTFNKKIIAPAGVQGNADSATKLQATRKINGTNFDGTSDITVNPVVQYINTDTDVFKLSNGFYYFNGVVAANKPSASTNWFTVEVMQIGTDGFMRLIDNLGLSFWTKKSNSNWGPWQKDADDSTVVHNTGTETIAGNKTFTGNTTFTQLIDGYVKTKIAQSTDVNLIKTQGKYHLEANYTNIPVGMPGSAILIVERNASGTICYQYIFSRNVMNNNGDIDFFMRLNINDTWTTWRRMAQDQNVVHNTGTETINGDKTFMSGSYGLRVTSTGIQKTSNSGGTWANI